ncbi:MAG TPA: glycosyltransferase family 4 protein [Gammaproteobacteria bacterium]|nr:glycosyltransferase family 4 protein [Gammaproteobacteria bacterium]
MGKWVGSDCSSDEDAGKKRFIGAGGVRLLVLSSLFPRPGQEKAGLFIRERMFRVGRVLPLVVVSPVPWFPLQGLIRRWRPHYRPPAPRWERQQGVEVYHPRFLALPGLFRAWDGFCMALACVGLLRRLRRRFDFQLIDAHFAYPDGYAATRLGRWFGVPVCITLRGTEVPHARDPARRARMVRALSDAARVFAVSDSLRRHAMALGLPGDKIRVVGNGVDTEKFYPVDRAAARRKLGLAADARVLITVGALVERKGFHRVIECLPALVGRYPDLHYLIVGGASPEGDWRARLERLAAQLGVQERVHCLGALPPEELKTPLSAADLFVLATRNEGWANVLLEAMACGLPVVATDVGGNAEVVCRDELGIIVPFGDNAALRDGIDQALRKAWDEDAIIAYARANSWDDRVRVLCEEFNRLLPAPGAAAQTEETAR